MLCCAVLCCGGCSDLKELDGFHSRLFAQCLPDLHATAQAPPSASASASASAPSASAPPKSDSQHQLSPAPKHYLLVPLRAAPSDSTAASATATARFDIDWKFVSDVLLEAGSALMPLPTSTSTSAAASASALTNAVLIHSTTKQLYAFAGAGTCPPHPLSRHSLFLRARLCLISVSFFVISSSFLSFFAGADSSSVKVVRLNPLSRDVLRAPRRLRPPATTTATEGVAVQELGVCGGAARRLDVCHAMRHVPSICVRLEQDLLVDEVRFE